MMQYFHFSNVALQLAFDTIMADLMAHPDVTTDDLWQLLGDEQHALLMVSMQQLKKKSASDEEVKKSVCQLVVAAKRRALRAEIEHKNAEYLTTEDPKIKDELIALQDEMKKLTEDE